jgi:hypothetical protein
VLLTSVIKPYESVGVKLCENKYTRKHINHINNNNIIKWDYGHNLSHQRKTRLISCLALYEKLAKHSIKYVQNLNYLINTCVQILMTKCLVFKIRFYSLNFFLNEHKSNKYDSIIPTKLSIWNRCCSLMSSNTFGLFLIL